MSRFGSAAYPVILLWLLVGLPAQGGGSHAATLVDAGVTAARQHEFRRALGYFDQALQQPNLTPREQSVILDNRGNAHKKLGNYTASINDYTWALLLAPELAKPLYDRGVVHFIQGEFAAAADDLQAFLQQMPDIASPYPHLWLYLARARASHDKKGGNHLENTLFLEQITWPSPLIRLHREELDVTTLLSHTAHHTAQKHLENQCDAFFHLGEYHLLRGDGRAARSWFRRALDTGMVHLDEYAAARGEWLTLKPPAGSSLPSLLDLDPELFQQKQSSP
ncbi:MAG: tetratricopeptide repeat protein [Magnetococcus sp. DMHC-1]